MRRTNDVAFCKFFWTRGRDRGHAARDDLFANRFGHRYRLLPCFSVRPFRAALLLAIAWPLFLIVRDQAAACRFAFSRSRLRLKRSFMRASPSLLPSCQVPNH